MSNNLGDLKEKLSLRIQDLIRPLGYELVALEVHRHKEKKIQIFIDFDSQESNVAHSIGIEDCATVSRALDEPLDEAEEVLSIFHDESYHLEVSSPGLNRPLRQKKDYVRFQGEQIKVHLFRPLSEEEIENPNFFEKNPKQKTFSGKIDGLLEEKLKLMLAPQSKKETKPTSVMIPLALITKAHLDPPFSVPKADLRKE